MKEKQIIELLSRRKSLTDDDKAVIKAMAKEAKLSVKFGKACANCYEDALVLLANHYGVTYKDGKPLTKSGNYYYMPKGSIVWMNFGRKIVLNEGSDDATIKEFMRINPRQKYFVPVTDTIPESDEEKGGEDDTE